MDEPIKQKRPISVTQRQLKRHTLRANWLTGVAAAIGLAALVADYGFERVFLSTEILRTLQIIAAVGMVAGKTYLWIKQVPLRRGLLVDLGLLVLMGLALLFLPSNLGQWAPEIIVRWIIFQIYLLIAAVSQIGRLSMAAAASGRAPARALMASFVVIIMIGALLLMLPAAHRGQRLSFTDAVFTATSATCVTGLIVRDTGSGFTRMGQSVILVMIQAGGLGIMLFGALFSMLLSSRLSLRESMAMGDIMNEQSPARIGRMVVFVILMTVVIEVLGVLCSYGMWQTDEVTGGQLFKSIFHAISAYCNAGFSLQTDSLGSYQAHWKVYAVIVPLIIVGGLGFPVLDNLFAMMASRWRRRRQDYLEMPVRLNLHSKIVLATTLVLLVLGWLLLGVLESTGRQFYTTEPGWEVWRDSWFNSVTARTAGFNTIQISALTPASKLTMILLMFVGGSPSSTAGGIKTVTLAVMFLTVYATMRRQQLIQTFKRKIHMTIVRKASTLMLMYGLLLWLLTLLLSITEQRHGWDLLDLMFEAASALGTVGLSTGVTEQLTFAGKWVIIVAMLIGRLGPLSLLAALAARSRQVSYEYPAESLVVG